MVSRDNRHIAFAENLFIVRHINIKEILDTHLRSMREIRAVIIPHSEQLVIKSAEIRVKSACTALCRIAPFGNKRRLGIFLIYNAEHLLPKFNRFRLIFIVLYYRRRHIDTETVTAHIKPKAHYINKLLP